MGIMKRNSLNHQNCGECPFATISGTKVLEFRTQANAHGVEWHHAAGHSSGRERISFFPKNQTEREAIIRLGELVDQAKVAEKKEKSKLKKKGLPTSKAALWRHLEANGKENKGFGSVDIKSASMANLFAHTVSRTGFYFTTMKKSLKSGENF